MKAQVKVSPGLIIEVEASKQKDLFKAIASAHEVYGQPICGLCGSTDVVPVHRTVTTVKGKKPETFEYAEFHCRGKHQGKRCGARLALGNINDDTGTLFPIRKLVNDGERPANKAEKDAGNDGEYGTHNGWHRYSGKRDAE